MLLIKADRLGGGFLGLDWVGNTKLYSLDYRKAGTVVCMLQWRQSYKLEGWRNGLVENGA
jgi:hypothetical protein